MRIAKVLLSVSALILLAAPDCLACDCRTLTEGQSFDEADAVVIGEVARIEAWGSGSTTVLRVQETLKGDVTGEMAIRSALSDCDAEFYPGHKYIVYARKWEEGYSAGSCMRTRALYATRPRGSRGVFAVTLLAVLGSSAVGFLVGRLRRGTA